MKKRLRIGITGNDNIAGYDTGTDFPRDYTPHYFVTAVQKTGNLPMIIPISSDLSMADSYTDQLNGLIFTGGQDVHPSIYNEEPRLGLGQTHLDRDLWEQALFQSAQEKNVPVLAICRGFQLINVLLGGSLYQDLSDLPTDPENQVQHLEALSLIIYPHHTIAIREESMLFKLLGGKKETRVNSYHHQAIKKLAPSLEATAWTRDGVIEAFENKSEQSDQLILGIQWHPEVMLRRNDDMLPIFDWFNQITKNN